MPRGKRSDWISINVFFFLLIYRKRKFCAEPMRERLTFHFELRTRSGNFRFFFSSFLLSFCFSNQGKISSCNNKKKRTGQPVDFAVLTDHTLKVQEK